MIGYKPWLTGLEIVAFILCSYDHWAKRRHLSHPVWQSGGSRHIPLQHYAQPSRGTADLSSGWWGFRYIAYPPGFFLTSCTHNWADYWDVKASIAEFPSPIYSFTHSTSMLLSASFGHQAGLKTDNLQAETKPQICSIWPTPSFNIFWTLKI